MLGRVKIHRSSEKEKFFRRIEKKRGRTGCEKRIV